MNSLTDNSFTAYVGIDWADSKHDICVQAAGDQQREFDCIAHQVDQIEQWAQSLHKRFGGVIAVALELSKGPIVYALQKYDFFVIFPVNPSTLAKYREAVIHILIMRRPSGRRYCLYYRETTACVTTHLGGQ